jgi:hypothetical protein
MRNVKVMIKMESIYWSAWQQLRDKLQGCTGERKHISTEEMKKKNKDEEKHRKDVITKNYITQP